MYYTTQALHKPYKTQGADPAVSGNQVCILPAWLHWFTVALLLKTADFMLHTSTAAAHADRSHVLSRNLNYWDSVSTLAGEVPNPAKTFPKALFGAVILVVSTYALPLIVGLGVTTDIADWKLGYFASLAKQVMLALTLAAHMRWQKPKQPCSVLEALPVSCCSLHELLQLA